MRSKGQESATSGWPCPDAKTQLSDSKTGKIVVVGIESAYQPLVDAEGRVREALEREFGQAFQKRTLQVGQTIDGNPAHKEFDAVSSDCKIIAMVKDYTAKNIAGNQTRHARVIRDLYYLPLARAERRFMYLSQEFLGWFRQQNDAVVPPNVEVRRIPL
jgi:hypothetical protein